PSRWLNGFLSSSYTEQLSPMRTTKFTSMKTSTGTMPNSPGHWRRVIHTLKCSSAANFLPAPDAANIDMDKIGTRIISHASAMQGQSSIAKLGSAYAGHADIDCHRLHVQTMQRHGVSMFPEIFVGPWRSISTEHVDLGIWTP